jgi:hypothetical protein
MFQTEIYYTKHAAERTKEVIEQVFWTNHVSKRDRLTRIFDLIGSKLRTAQGRILRRELKW